MRIVFRMIILGVGLTTAGSLVYAAPEFQLGKTALEAQWKEGKTVESIISSGFESDWDWLKLGVDTRLYLQSPDNDYSKVATKILWPGISKKLNFDWDYQWNRTYYISTVETSCQWSWFNNLKLQLKIKNGLRNAADGQDSEYRYSLDQQILKADYDQKRWSYQFVIDRANRDYSIRTYYTSLKMQLNQKVTWKINPNLQGELSYQESTGDYPFDTSLTRSYWREKWGLGVNYRFKKERQLTVKTSIQDWDQGFSHYRNERQFEVKWLTKLDSLSKLAVSVNHKELDYHYEGEYYDPGDVIVEEDDLKSRVEQKIGLEYQRRFANTIMDLGYLMGKDDYINTGVPDTLKTAFYGILTWGLNRFTFKLKAAPNGDLQQNKGYYQVKLEYRPD